MQAAALTAYELFCRRGERLLFSSLDLSMRQGEAIRVIGPNGTGKTSLIRILAGLLPPSPTGLPEGCARSGSVQWSGGVALLDQRLALDEHLPLAEALRFWSKLDSAGQVDLGRLGLDRLMDIPVRYLSTGQRKRAAIARMMSQQAPNWLLDEPLNGLDDAGIVLVERLIAEHRFTGGTVVVASHQPIDLPGAQVVDIPKLSR